MDIRVPHLADGINSGTIVNIFVSKGERVQKDQDILEIETEKAVAAVPAPEEGTVSEILVKSGDKVNVGQVVMRLGGGTPATEKQVLEKAEPVTPTQAGISEGKSGSGAYAASTGGMCR